MLRDLVIEARSYRSFDESKPVYKETLEALLDTARLCSSAVNRQPLKYRLVYEKNEVEDTLALTKWAGALTDMKFPPDGHHPTAFIVMCCDTSITEGNDWVRFDAGIAAEAICLGAAEIGLGTCIIGAFNPEEMSKALLISKKYKPIAAIAFGVPDETVFICNVPETGNTIYYRDKANIHYVPKRSLEEIIIE